MGGEKHAWFWSGNLMETYHLDDPVIDGRIILKRVFGKWDGGHGLDCSGSEKGQVLVNMTMYLWIPNNVRIS